MVCRVPFDSLACIHSQESQVAAIEPHQRVRASLPSIASRQAHLLLPLTYTGTLTVLAAVPLHLQRCIPSKLS